MKKLNSLSVKPLLILTTAIGSALLVSCSPVPQNLSSAPKLQENVASKQAENDSSAAVAQEPKLKAQLIKKASLQIVVDSVNDSINNISKIVTVQQGDVLKLQDNKPADGVRHSASIEIRVPQEKLDLTLEELTKLGKVQNRTISTEDVSTQLVDIDARLRNLRRTETVLLGIMERSGAVPDVLKVSQELSTVRQQIEQIDAQFRNLKNQVAYSTITLAIEETFTPSSVPERSIDIQLKEVWNRSTRSLGEFTTGLLGHGIWLLVFSPYLFIAGGIFWLIKSRKFKKVKQTTPTPSDPSE